MKRTYSPSNIKRARKHGFRSKMKTKGGKKLLARRRAKGRKSLTVSVQQMKSKIIALSKNEDFKDLLKQKKISNKYTTIYFGSVSNKNHKKLNISFVTKKKIGNAVKRNKIKRRLRNVTNEMVKKIPLNLDYSYLVIAKITMLNSDYIKIKETLFADFKKIK